MFGGQVLARLVRLSFHPANRSHSIDTVPNTFNEQSQVEVLPVQSVEGRVRPPGSKSLTNRALICAAFADGSSSLSGALRSEDTTVMIEALRSIGVNAETSNGGRKIVVDSSKRDVLSASSERMDLFIANSGTTVRFLTAALSAAGGNYRLHGVPRMHERPIGDLIHAIEPVQHGSICTESPNECPPVVIESDGWSESQIKVAGSVSSQYLSGLMMAAPINAVGDDVTIRVEGELVSRPYVDMTAELMRAFGAQVNLNDEDDALEVMIAPKQYQAKDYEIEPDASAASYFWAAAAITGGDVTVEGLSKNALQGDVRFCEVLEQMGCEVEYDEKSIRVRGRAEHGVDVDMNHISDTVQTLAVVALFADGPTRVRGVAHNRFKETDRIGDLATELRKLGADVDEHPDGMTITPPRDPNGLRGATIETYHDHRMAMSLSLAGLKIPGVRICDPSCTSKTYPEYFADLERLTGQSHRWHGVGNVVSN